MVLCADFDRVFTIGSGNTAKLWTFIFVFVFPSQLSWLWLSEVLYSCLKFSVLRTATHTGTWQSLLVLISRWLSTNTTMRSVGMPAQWFYFCVCTTYLLVLFSSSLVFICHYFDNEYLSFYCLPSQVIDMIGRTFVHIFKGLRDRYKINVMAMLWWSRYLRVLLLCKKGLSPQHLPVPKRIFFPFILRCCLYCNGNP